MFKAEKLYADYRLWSKKKCTAAEGIIVGSDLTQEWILPWWLTHYRRHNTHPVAFVDFGMSEEMKKWCQTEGELVRLFVADVFVAEKNQIDPSLALSMEKACGKEFWPSRDAWFKKPLACLQSPFNKSVWIDLDCQIRGSLKPLFKLSNENLAIARDFIPENPVYNSGVFAFKKGLKLIEKWADACFERNHEFRGDQDVLNALIQEQNIPLSEISPLYNWSRCHEEHPEAVIIHWHGPHGKAIIYHQIAMSSVAPMFNCDSI